MPAMCCARGTTAIPPPPGPPSMPIGVLAAASSVFPMLLAVHAGKLTDRFGARWLLMSGALGAGVVMLLPYFAPGLPAILAAAAMIGLADAIFSVSVQNLVGILSSFDNLTRNFNYYSLA